MLDSPLFGEISMGFIAVGRKLMIAVGDFGFLMNVYGI